MLQLLNDYLNKLQNSTPEVLIISNLFLLFSAVFFSVASIKLLINKITAFQLYVWSQYFSSVDYVERYGKWALVTGATDGIGLEMARELARRGHSLILVGRNEEKLARSKQLVTREFNSKSSNNSCNRKCEVVTVRIDLASPSSDEYDMIAYKIDPMNRDIGILINNAGMTSELVARFHRQPQCTLSRMVNVNCLAATQFTRMVLPGMLLRNRGLIVNVSSLFGHKSFVVENANLYCSSKAFMRQFSRQLQLEYRNYPIDIIDTDCGFINGGVWAKTSKDNWTLKFMATPEEFAKSFVNCLATRVGFVHGHLWSEIQMNLFNVAKFFHLHRVAINILQNVSIDDANVTPKSQRRRLNRFGSQDLRAI